MKTIISNLPMELAEEILSRVPMKSMKTVRSTCKKWNNLSKIQSFMKMHIAKEAAATREGESTLIAMMNYRLYLMNVFIGEADPSIELKGKLSCLDEQDKISKVFHCEGLLLCIFKEDSRFLVWNPYLRQKRWIEPRYYHSLHGMDMFSYALGYEDKESCRSLKLMRFIDYWYNAPENQFFWYEIYDFDSGLWTTLDVTPHWCIAFANLGVFLKGKTYWCASDRSSRDEVDRIVSFDFTKERFGPLLPLPFSALYDEDYMTLSCVREEKLAVLLQHNESNPYELDIWITTKIESQEVSWIKFLRMETECDIEVPNLGEGFFIDEEKKVAIGFDDENRHTVDIVGETGHLRQLEILSEPAHPCCTPQMCTYVPSLVQIKQPPGSGRKQQSQLEKRRFDENKLRLAAFEANELAEDARRIERINLNLIEEKRLLNINEA